MLSSPAGGVSVILCKLLNKRTSGGPPEVETLIADSVSGMACHTTLCTAGGVLPNTVNTDVAHGSRCVAVTAKGTHSISADSITANTSVNIAHTILLTSH